MALDNLSNLAADSEVALTLRIGHETPVESGAIADLLESLSTLHELIVGGGDSNFVYQDQIADRWRLRRNADGLLPETPLVLETDAEFLITFVTVVGVATIVGTVVGTIQLAMSISDKVTKRREARRQARQAAAAGNVPTKIVQVAEQLGGDITINGNGNTVIINIQQA